MSGMSTDILSNTAQQFCVIQKNNNAYVRKQT